MQLNCLHDTHTEKLSSIKTGKKPSEEDGERKNENTEKQRRGREEEGDERKPGERTMREEERAVAE